MKKGVFVILVLYSVLGVVTAGTTVINDCNDLQNLNSHVGVAHGTGHEHVITQNIDCSGIPNFDPIGITVASPLSSSTAFNGVLIGNGFYIENLNINRPAEDGVGLISYLGVGGRIINVSLRNASIKGRKFVGGLLESSTPSLKTSQDITHKPE